MVNCGGVIQVAEELVGCDLDRARARTARVFATTPRVLERAASDGVTPVAAASGGRGPDPGRADREFRTRLWRAGAPAAGTL